MTTQTSIDSYKQLCNEQRNQHQRDRILQFILTHPQCSRNDIKRALKDIEINAVTGRVNELIQNRYVQPNGIKKDRLTGRQVETLQGCI